MSEIKKKVPVNAGRFSAGADMAVSEDGKRFTLVPYAGQQFKHWYWGKLAFDTEGLSMRKKVIPAFKDHCPDKFVGEIDEMKVKDGKVMLSGAFADTDAAAAVRSTKKLEWECSLAFNLGAARIEEVGEDADSKVNGQKFDGPGHIVREAQLYECSFTFWGAVPGTEVAFSDNKDEVEVSIFSTTVSGKGENMSEELKGTKDEGRAESLGMFKKMNELCEDKVFVAECFAKGLTLEQFQSELLKKLSDESAQLRKERDELKAKSKSEGAAPVGFSAAAAPAPEPEKLGFVESARKMAKEEKISFCAAASRLAAKDPALYQAHLDACPVSKIRK